QDTHDLSKFRFLEWLPTKQLVQLLNLSDLHIYLTTPFPLSWSLFNALACGATVLASDTEPVREVIENEKHGLLADFFDVDRMAEVAVKVLREPQAYKHLGKAGAELIRQKYSTETVMPQFAEYFERQAKANG